ncbi:AraC family transcriptional regulator [Paenibacillus ginsengarvi]|uniref:AraC family transcriptional regulator n=1 Tax=Paenibacillus ginsengarvi TaxID=400777 RepID=A0A3B0CNJ2_9BACL|nr:AraC family transcriptional regulator [Paenibacillus ginsengarvi]RKN86431.1 AraC family transcriptional regulator [Paenibacillus ginsengarvi]
MPGKQQPKHYVYEDSELLVGYSQYFGMFDMTDNHLHDTHELYYLMSGRRNYFIKDRLYPIRKGDLVFVPKDELHRTLAADTTQHDRLVIHFKEELLTTFMDTGYAEYLLRPYRAGLYTVRLEPDDRQALESIVFRIVQDLKEQPDVMALQMRVLVLDLLLFVGRRMEKYEAAVSPFESHLHRKISEIAAYINANYMYPLTLAHLSETFYWSPYYISRVFKEMTGFSFVQYLTYARIGEAKRLLRETDKLVLSIAAQVGFENLAHFNRVFKQTVHLSPSQYRRMAERK